MRHVTAERFCERCKDTVEVKLVRNITQSGVSQVYWYCIFGTHAIKKGGGFIAHERIRNAGYNPDDLPVIENYSGQVLCAVCQSPFTELHHFAPKHLFGTDADKWPTAYLCKPHHDLWHELVTPNMPGVKHGNL